MQERIYVDGKEIRSLEDGEVLEVITDDNLPKLYRKYGDSLKPFMAAKLSNDINHNNWRKYANFISEKDIDELCRDKVNNYINWLIYRKDIDTLAEFIKTFNINVSEDVKSYIEYTNSIIHKTVELAKDKLSEQNDVYLKNTPCGSAVMIKKIQDVIKLFVTNYNPSGQNDVVVIVLNKG